MKRFAAMQLGLLFALPGALPMPASADSVYRLGPVDDTALPNPAPATSVQFGTTMAAGDFNDDNISDLAVAAYAASELRVYFGQEWTVGGGVLPADRFTVSVVPLPFQVLRPALAAGDFDGDSDDELAIGNPEFSDVASGAGRVLVLRYTGSAWAAQASIEQGQDGYAGALESGDAFGTSLAVGDFDDDGYDDLAIGVKGEDVGSVSDAGAVQIAYGSSTGITGARDQLITRNGDGLTVPPTLVELYGSTLASGDFNEDGYADIAIGALRARCPNGTDASGAVVMMLGSAGGIVNTGTRQFRPGVLGVQGTCTDNSVFGRALAAGGFDAGSSTDLAIATGDDAVHVLYGSAATGLQTDGDQRITPASLPGNVVGDTRFGVSLATGRFNDDPFNIFPGRSSLAIGANFDTVNGAIKAGSVIVVPGASSGLVPAESQRFTRSAALSIGPPVTVDLFGASLAGGDFNDDGQRDLAIGIPYFDLDGFGDRGAVEVLYSSECIFRSGFQ
ncbi:MAG TPA: FG-GAP repeat protein [Tahibacter sp.]|uniref:FG-GAP repeat protein n=1 Tax=Tahibacter sp. TaxID=2056211 RepID=UPI002C9D10A2|nr:FG-GAP repeat protein [Tahibacter sp.]HSX59078.1 FG-GAP repeat protein [Tahibacter sp.]